MKVILLESVAKVGNVNEIVDVNDGYGMNYLIPQNLARPATAQAIAEAESKREEYERRDEERKAAVKSTIEKLSGTTLTLTLPANDQGTLFSAVSPETISEFLAESQNIELDPSHIELEAAIKETGEYVAEISIDDTKGKLTVIVEAEEEN